MALLDEAEAFQEYFKTTYDVDTTDRLKYTHSMRMLGVLAALTFAANYVGQPMQCWVPKQFSDRWEDYAETYCLIEGTYHVNMNDSNLPSVEERKNREIMYYQWVPFILALNAIFLYAPRLLWKVLQKTGDVEMKTVTVELRNNAKNFMKTDVSMFEDVPNVEWLFGRRLTIRLLSSKIVSLFLLITQTLVLEWLISGKIFAFYGVTVLADALSGRQWQESGMFPRVTFCDFEIRELGQVHRWSLQCVLMVNMFNEKIFIFVWWWFVMLILVTVVNLVKWVLRLFQSNQYSFLKEVASLYENNTVVTPSNINEFRENVLRTDGVTFLRLVKENATLNQVSVFAELLWKAYFTRKEGMQKKDV